MRKMMMLKISSLPRSMFIDKSHLPGSGIRLKFPIDPTDPNPGPTPPMVAAEPEKAVRRSTFIKVRRRVVRKMTPR